MQTASKSKAAHANYAIPNSSPYVTNTMLLNFLPSKQQLLLLEMNTAYQAPHAMWKLGVISNQHPYSTKLYLQFQFALKETKREQDVKSFAGGWP